MIAPHESLRLRERVIWKDARCSAGWRDLACERAVAMRYDGETHAVLLATPCDLHDFAIGFSVTEGLVSGPDEVENIDVVDHGDGIELRMTLAPARRGQLPARRRNSAGPSGCGLCGIGSLSEATRPAVAVSATTRFTAGDVSCAIASLAHAMPIGAATRSVHGAGFWHPGLGLVAVREDVGRHNALDKLVGALAQGDQGLVGGGIVVLTSRVSIELVQKAARLGAGVLAAMSAPTTLAVQYAEASGLTLVAVARSDGFEVFARADRIAFPGEVGSTADN